MKSLARAILPAVLLLGFAAAAQAQPDLTWSWPGSWSYPVVPRASFHTPPNVWLSDELEGNTTTTYWNVTGVNQGDTPVAPGMYGFLSIDGSMVDYMAWNDIPAGSLFYAPDRGPINVRGGRHVLSVLFDATGVVAETDETNNAWGRQFAWTPHWLGNSESLLRSQPPDPMGGWSDLGVPSEGYNCDGFGFSTYSPWTGVALHAVDPAADYDLSMFEVPAIWDEAYSVSVGGSAVGAGHLDFVLANNNQVGATDYLVGVVAYSGAGDFVVQEVHNWFMNIGDLYPTTLAQDEYLKIWNLDIAPGDVGPLLMCADAEPDAQLRLAVFDASFTVGGLLDAAVIDGSADDGTLRYVHDFAAPGAYAVVVYRDPVDGTGPVDFTLQVRREIYDYAPAHLANWHSPLTPRPAADGTPASTPLPAQLDGWSPSTYFNVAVLNAGSTAMDAVMTVGYRDGLSGSPGNGFIRSAIVPIGAGGTAALNNIGPLFVPGGRHTWTVEIDPNDNVFEADESNNVWGEQFVWSPWPLNFDTQIYMDTDQDIFGGAATITSGEAFDWNCDGYRLTGSSGWWNVVAAIHDPADDYDLQLHDASTGPKNGFDTYQAGSAMAGGETDFVVVNRNVVGWIDVDVGVTRYQGGSTYGLDTRESVVVTDPTLDPLGPATMADGDMITVWDVWLDADVYAFALENLAGTVDWGFQLMPYDLAYAGRYDFVPGAVAYDNGPGVNEWFSVTVTQPGWYGLVAYKAREADAPLTGSFRVHVGRGGVSVEPGATPAVRASRASTRTRSIRARRSPSIWPCRERCGSTCTTRAERTCAPWSTVPCRRAATRRSGTATTTPAGGSPAACSWPGCGPAASSRCASWSC